MRSIKLLDIGYINVLYVIFALIFAVVTDRTLGIFSSTSESRKSRLRLTSEFLLAMWSFGVAMYVARNLVELAPFPLHGYRGFDHRRVKEMVSPAAFTFTYFLFSDYIKAKLLWYYTRYLRQTPTSATLDLARD